MIEYIYNFEEGFTKQYNKIYLIINENHDKHK